MDPMMMMALIGGGSGLAKGILVDEPRERRQRQLRADYLRVSPWLKVDVPGVQEADPLGGAIAGGLQGLAFGAANKDKLAGFFGTKDAAKEVAKASADTGPNYVNGAPTDPNAGPPTTTDAQKSGGFQWDLDSILNKPKESPWHLMDDGSPRKSKYSLFSI